METDRTTLPATRCRHRDPGTNSKSLLAFFHPTQLHTRWLNAESSGQPEITWGALCAPRDLFRASRSAPGFSFFFRSADCLIFSPTMAGAGVFKKLEFLILNQDFLKPPHSNGQATPQNKDHLGAPAPTAGRRHTALVQGFGHRRARRDALALERRDRAGHAAREGVCLRLLPTRWVLQNT
jgi:hypothetical protein